MLPIYTSVQIKELEQISCIEQKIESIQLMERAGQSFTLWFCSTFKDKSKRVHIFCGNGNNGGDGLVIARLLSISSYQCFVYCLNISSLTSKDFNSNFEKLKLYKKVNISFISPLNIDTLHIPSEDIILDAILGTGVNRPIEEPWSKVISMINSKRSIKVSIDLPSGLPTDNVIQGIAVQSDYVFGFEYPKLSYFLPEHSSYIKKWTVESIQLTKNTPAHISANRNLLEKKDIQNIIRPRNKFSYKNNFGHLLTIAGSKTMCGAAIISAKASMRSGCGLITMVTNATCKSDIFQMFPEAMVHEYDDFYSLLLQKYNAICVGSGMQGFENMVAFLNKCFSSGLPLVLDAEALQCLGKHDQLYKKIPKKSILTPHVGEFEKMVNRKFENSIDRLHHATEFAQKYKLFLVLKGAYTIISTPNGKQYFNPTGNQGMATAGCGDVLAGIIGSLLAQGYEPLQASILGVYLHGLAGDLALKKQSFESMIASDVIDHLGEGFKSLEPSELF